ncbi:hypothetical protein QBC47DRAFT_445285 [Echria macrotheca]|uniref:Uncharacterized protein n=1 Tax=Echria macrotheca TaxID=438768 RepID=A0AAJ0BE29_9PEZI|nr:hypothetical protein QBC47DRAFT_445285 [Echria macrotheca]
MPIRNTIKKGAAPPPDAKAPTGSYAVQMSRPTAYQPIRPNPTVTAPAFSYGDSIPAMSTRDLNYFFRLAASLYDPIEDPTFGPSSNASFSYPSPSSPMSGTSSSWSFSNLPPTASGPAAPLADAPPAYSHVSPVPTGGTQGTQGPTTSGGGGGIDPTALLVLSLFRQTRTDIHPISERFHLGTADRQPLYSLSAQPSIRSATEFNELAVSRRDPVAGTWHATCTAEIEPALELVKPGRWTVAKLVLDAMPVWKKMVSGRVVQSSVDGVERRGTRLSLVWGDRGSLGALGEAYGLWWDDGGEQGSAEAFYVCEGWRGFGTQGVIRVKSAARDAGGRYMDPRNVPGDLAVVYFFGDGKTPPRLVCGRADAQVRMDVLMAGLMVLMVVETRKAAVVKEYGSLPAYDSMAHWGSTLVERGPDYNEAYMS